MKLAVTLATAVFLSWTASGAQFTITDPYHGQNPGDTRGSQIGDGDVKGLLKAFDIEKVVIGNTGNDVSIQIYMNYGTNGGDRTLSPVVTSGFPNVFAGDFFFFGSSIYAIPLISHTATAPGAGGVSAFHLYQANSFITAGDLYPAEAISIPDAFRPGETVWVDPGTPNTQGEAILIQGPLSNNISLVNGAQILVSINFTNAAIATDISTGIFAMSFASATCGNDMIQGGGQSDTVPEPLTLSLMGCGLLGLGLMHRLRK